MKTLNLVLLMMAVYFFCLSHSGFAHKDSHILAQEPGLLLKPDSSLNPFTTLLAQDNRLEDFMLRYKDGENIILAFVDGKPVTTESIKNDLSTDFDALVNTELAQAQRIAQLQGAAAGSQIMNRKQAELLVIYKYARTQKVLDIILNNEAQALDLPIQEISIDRHIQNLQKIANIRIGDDEGWAQYTLQNFGKTPLEFRQDIREEVQRRNLLGAIAGEFGPLRGVDLPVFFPLEITPTELRQEYKRTKKQWRVLRNIDYDLLAIKHPRELERSKRIKIFEILNDTRARFVSGESFDALKRFMESEVEQLREVEVKVEVQTNIKAFDDSALDELGQSIRSLSPGEISQTQKSIMTQEGESWEYTYIVRLNQSQDDVSRNFVDPIVQRDLYQKLYQQKLEENHQRARIALLRRAVIVPQTFMRLQSQTN